MRVEQHCVPARAQLLVYEHCEGNLEFNTILYDAVRQESSEKCVSKYYQNIVRFFSVSLGVRRLNSRDFC